MEGDSADETGVMSFFGMGPMSENLVVIRTFRSLFDADEAQIELLSSGIYSLLYADESVGLQAGSPPAQAGIALAVHQRDVELAEAALSATKCTRDNPTDVRSGTNRLHGVPE